MRHEEAVELKDFLQEQGYEAELYEDYSGRGMYGRTTTSVTTDASFGDMECMEEELEMADIDPAFRHDSMGLDFIYY